MPKKTQKTAPVTAQPSGHSPLAAASKPAPKPATAAKPTNAAKSGPKKQASKADQSAASGAQAQAILGHKGQVLKVIMFADEIEAAFSESLSEAVSHPLGNIDDQLYWPGWAAEIRRRMALKLGVRESFVTVAFHTTDRLGASLPADGNLIRVSAKVGDQIRHTLLSDPTPED